MNGTDCTAEELALSMRLYDIWSKSSEQAAGKWVEVARECIRQMQWARHETAAQAEKVFDYHTQEAIGQWDRGDYGNGARTFLTIVKRDTRRNWESAPLTLAPEDWKP